MNSLFLIETIFSKQVERYRKLLKKKQKKKERIYAKS